MSSLDFAGDWYADIQPGIGIKAAATSFGSTIHGTGIRCLAGRDHGRINAVFFAARDVGHVTGELSPQSR